MHILLKLVDLELRLFHLFMLIIAFAYLISMWSFKKLVCLYLLNHNIEIAATVSYCVLQWVSKHHRLVLYIYFSLGLAPTRRFFQLFCNQTWFIIVHFKRSKLLVSELLLCKRLRAKERGFIGSAFKRLQAFGLILLEEAFKGVLKLVQVFLDVIFTNHWAAIDRPGACFSHICSFLFNGRICSWIEQTVLLL